jgi:hypothetical protein
MTVAKVIRYRVKPALADENERLIRDVFAELAAGEPEGLRYATFRLADDVSFLHVALIEGEVNPLFESAAFGAFQSQFGDRIVEGPDSTDATLIGSYRLLTS